MKMWREECGVFGIWNLPEAARMTYLGLYAMQHRGQESAGIVTLQNGEHIIHHAKFKETTYQRNSFWSTNFNHGFTFNWTSTYYEVIANGQLKELGQDNSVIRSFTKDEFFIFLSLAGFEVKEVIARDSYAFDTFVIVAQKITEL